MRRYLVVNTIVTLWFGSYFLFDLVPPLQPVGFFVLPIPWDLKFLSASMFACAVSFKPTDCLFLLVEAWSVPGIPTRIAILALGSAVAAGATWLERST